MKLSGHVKLEIVNELTGEIVNTIEQDNIITDVAYTHVNMILEAAWQARTIFISTEVATPVRSKTSIQCSGTAYQGTGQPPVQAFHNANPPYFVITQRIDAVVTPRTFQTIGLCTGFVGQVVNTTVAPWAYLLLNQPCTQEANQVLNLTYRITVQDTVAAPNLSKSNNPRWINDLCRGLIHGSSTGPTLQKERLHNMTAYAPLKEYGWRSLYLHDLFSQIGANANAFTVQNGQENSVSDRSLFYRYRQYWSTVRNNTNCSFINGKLLNGLLTGKNIFLQPATANIVESDPGITGTAYASFNALGESQTVNLQSAFAYSAAPRDDIGPMFLPDNNPSGTGSIEFSEDPWTGDWPKIYRIRITESGNVGTAKFVLGVKHFTSFHADESFTYSDTSRAFHPYVISVIQPYAKCHGWQLPMPILAWDNLWTVQADNTGVSIINQFTGQHYDLDATTTPALPITDFRQMAFDQANNYIYVACSATGLWRLNIANKASIVVTNISTTPAYAVDVTASGIVYAVMNLSTTVLSLTSSVSNYTADLGFTTVALSTSNRLNIYVNKIHADTRIAIAVRNNPTDSFGLAGANIYWWSLAVGNEGSFTTNLEYCGESQCSFTWLKNSDTRLWSGTGVLMVYGTNTAIGGTTRKITPATINTINVNYDPEARRLLNGGVLSQAQYANVNCAQDYWGCLIPCGYNVNNGGHKTNVFINPSTGVLSIGYNNSPINKVKLVGMPNGIVLCETAIAYIWNNGMNNSINQWIWYKWNGTNWVPAVDYDVVNNTFTDTTGTDTRTTSTSFVDLIDGINVRFANGLTGTSFIVNEVYDQYVAKGILKTNDTSVYVENCPFYTQPLYEKVTLTPRVITAPNNHAVVVDGAPGNTSISAATSAIAVNPLWYALLPEYFSNTMQLFIDGVPITSYWGEGRDVLPAQNTLTAGQVIGYRNGLLLCSTADVGKTVTGYFSYVARSD